MRVKGRAQPVAIFEPLGLADELSAEQNAELLEYEAALDAYRQQDWSRAQAGFERLRERQPDCMLYRVYWDRVAALRAEPPPPDWDGVFNLESK